MQRTRVQRRFPESTAAVGEDRLFKTSRACPAHTPDGQWVCCGSNVNTPSSLDTWKYMVWSINLLASYTRYRADVERQQTQTNPLTGFQDLGLSFTDGPIDLNSGRWESAPEPHNLTFEKTLLHLRASLKSGWVDWTTVFDNKLPGADVSVIQPVSALNGFLKLVFDTWLARS